MTITKYVAFWNMLTLAHRSPTARMRNVWRTLLRLHGDYGGDPILARTLSRLEDIERPTRSSKKDRENRP